jgi:hypothetical protein
MIMNIPAIELSVFSQPIESEQGNPPSAALWPTFLCGANHQKLGEYKQKNSCPSA